ncbi:MAG TPA: histidine kinase dimerization/phospho-acceptor domain-containing protein, partial [Gemmatimonadales bacterium]|nr:histidine kinase dimerization/phospho-acceptor domain-containing protein [Gemmatimonadales bacterium]
MSRPASGNGLAPEALAELRHDLRTPLNHVIGYTEMLLEDAADPALASRRAPLQQTLTAARHALERINATLGTVSGAGAGEVARLFEDLREPRERIIQA